MNISEHNIRSFKSRIYSLPMHVHKHQVYLLEQHSESFKIWLAITRINTEGKSLIMKLSYLQTFNTDHSRSTNTDWLYTVWLYTVWLYTVWLYTDWLYTVWLYTVWLYTVWLYTDWLYTDWLYTDWLYTVCTS